MTQAEKAEYCRQKGIYLAQLEQWEIACLSGFNTTPALNLKQKNEQKQKDIEINGWRKNLIVRIKRWYDFPLQVKPHFY
jgi:hypothetical protein